MNANFGILPPLAEIVKDKQEKYKKQSDRSLENITNILDSANFT